MATMVDGYTSFHLCFGYIKHWKRITASSRKDPNITKKDIEVFLLNYPSITEQQKIGALFAKLDNLIDLQAKKLELLKQLKQGLLQRLFPQNNQTTPQLRFKGFNEEWCKKYLKDIGNTYTGLTGKTKEDFGHGKAHFITFLNVLTNPITDKNMLDKLLKFSDFRPKLVYLIFSLKLKKSMLKFNQHGFYKLIILRIMNYTGTKVPGFWEQSTC